MYWLLGVEAREACSAPLGGVVGVVSNEKPAPFAVSELERESMRFNGLVNELLLPEVALEGDALVLKGGGALEGGGGRFGGVGEMIGGIGEGRSPMGGTGGCGTGNEPNPDGAPNGGGGDRGGVGCGGGVGADLLRLNTGRGCALGDFLEADDVNFSSSWKLLRLFSVSPFDCERLLLPFPSDFFDLSSSSNELRFPLLEIDDDLLPMCNISANGVLGVGIDRRTDRRLDWICC